MAELWSGKNTAMMSTFVLNVDATVTVVQSCEARSSGCSAGPVEDQRMTQGSKGRGGDTYSGSDTRQCLLTGSPPQSSQALVKTFSATHVFISSCCLHISIEVELQCTIRAIIIVTGLIFKNDAMIIIITSLMSRHRATRDGGAADEWSLATHSSSHRYWATATARPALPQAGKPVVPRCAAGKP